MTKFSDLRALLTKPDLTVATLTTALTVANEHKSATLTAIDTLEAGRGEMLLAPETQRLLFRADLTAARDAAEDAAALVGLIEARLGSAQKEEAKAARRELRAKAESLAEAARKAIRRYPKVAKEIVEILEAAALADQAIEGSNQDLPEGCEPLLSPELETRGRKGRDGHVLSDEVVVLWAYAGSGDPVPEHLRDTVQDMGGGRGGLAVGPTTMGSSFVPLIRRRFRRIERVASVATIHPERLAQTVVLPRFNHLDPTIYEPARSYEGRVVVAHIGRLRSLPSRRDAEAEPVVEYVALSDAVEEPVTPPCASQSRPSRR